MKTSLLTIIFLGLTTLIFAQIPTNYYSTADGKKGEELKTSLYNIIKNHTVVSYGDLYELYKTSDTKPNNVVWDMYSDVPGGSPAYVFYHSINNCSSSGYSAEGECYNREHLLPRSWFDDDNSPMFSDAFHVVPTDGFVNSKRSNYPFSEVGTATWTSSNGSKLGNSSFTGFSSTAFEPIDEYKGDIARSYFYMATRYENVIGNWKINGSAINVLDGSFDKVFQDWTLNLLRKWHTEDPVSQKEIDRNNAIYTQQNNRNPFIDHPEYVAEIWDNLGTAPYQTLLYENFEGLATINELLAKGWVMQNEAGNETWEFRTYSNNQYIQFSSYNNGEASNIGWLISPAIDLSTINDAQFTFNLKAGYDNGATIDCYVLTNYQTAGNPWSATKTALTFTRPTAPSNAYGSWADSESIDLSSYNGTIHLAWKYTGGNTAPAKTTTWQVDNVLVKAPSNTTSITKQAEINYNLYPNPTHGNITLEGEFGFDQLTVSLIDMSGKAVLSQISSNSGRINLDASHLSKGIYFLKIESKTKLFVTKKVMLH